jgi:hypothetical protein
MVQKLPSFLLHDHQTSVRQQVQLKNSNKKNNKQKKKKKKPFTRPIAINPPLDCILSVSSGSFGLWS